jgi:septum formation protein
LKGARIKKYKWVLASGSPRRKELLAQLKVPFEVLPSNIPENRRSGESPEQFVSRLSISKAKAVARKLSVRNGAAYLVLAADTIVVLGGKVFGKPRNVKHASWMLRRLSGRQHRVYTGVALVDAESGKAARSVAVSKVLLRTISKAESLKIGAKHLDKSGSYACQDKEDRLVEKVDGDWQTVMGLPLNLVKKLTSRISRQTS